MNQKNWKRIIAGMSAVVLSLSMLSACGSNKSAELAPDALTALTDEDAKKEALRVNDTVLTAGEMQYYVYNAAMTTVYGIDSSFTGDFTNFDWNQEVDGKPIEEVIMNTAVDNAVSDMITVQKGKDNGIEMTEEELAQVDTDVSTYTSQYGEDAFLLSMNAMAINNAEDYKNLYSLVVGAQKVDEDIQNNFDKYAPDKEDLKKYKSDTKATVQHILIMNDSENYENPEETINQVLERAKAGEDFVQLMNEFNEDTGETEAGYTFGPGEMVAEFEEASFNLDYDQISDVVKSDYGYHIIKRLVGTAELINSWTDGVTVKRNNKVLNKITAQNVIKAATNASTKLQAWSQSQSQNAAAGSAAADATESETEDSAAE